MAKQWRPKNWQEIKQAILPLRMESLDSIPFKLIEAGADAMLEALLNGDNFINVSKTAIVTPGFMTDLDDYLVSLGNGVFVFIPEVEDD